MTVEFDPNEQNNQEAAGGGGYDQGEDAYSGPYRPLKPGEEVDPIDITEDTQTREPLVPARKYGD